MTVLNEHAKELVPDADPPDIQDYQGVGDVRSNLNVVLKGARVSIPDNHPVLYFPLVCLELTAITRIARAAGALQYDSLFRLARWVAYVHYHWPKDVHLPDEPKDLTTWKRRQWITAWNERMQVTSAGLAQASAGTPGILPSAKRSPAP